MQPGRAAPLLCYFAHLLPFLMALGTIAVLWLVTLPGAPARRHLLHLAIVAPHLLLPSWFLWSQRGQPLLPAPASANPVWFLLRARPISLDGATLAAVAPPLCLLLAVLIAATLAAGWVVRGVDGGRRLVLRREDEASCSAPSAAPARCATGRTPWPEAPTSSPGSDSSPSSPWCRG